MLWVLNLEVASIDDDPTIASSFPVLVAALGDFGPEGKFDDNGWCISIEIDAPDVWEAISSTRRLILAAIDLAGMRRSPTINLSATDAELYAASL